MNNNYSKFLYVFAKKQLIFVNSFGILDKGTISV